MRKNYQLSKNFSFYEFTNTMFDDYLEGNRKLTDQQHEKLKLLAETIMQPIRDQFRLPIRINSGYRSSTLNARVGGATFSQHTLCEAVDFKIPGLDDMEGSMAVFDWIHFDSKIPFGQVIHEQKIRMGEGGYETIWIHISLGEPYRQKGTNREVLLMRNGIYQTVREGQ